MFRQVRVLDAIAQTEQIADILVNSDGVIQIDVDASQIPESVHLSDRAGLILGTELVDLYSYSGEPGRESRETLVSLAQAALQGGFGKVGILPDTIPAIDDITALEFWRQQRSLFLPWGAITRGCEGKQIADLAELSAAVVGFTDAKPLANLALVRHAMEYIKPLGKPLMLWAYDADLANNGAMREGKWSIQYGLAGIPAIAETCALANLLELVRLTKTPTHFMRISTVRSVELLAQAKADGLPVTASVPWMNLWLLDRDLHNYDPNLRLWAPLGNEQDRDALIEGLRVGTIDAIAVDHSPYTYEEKTVAFETAPPGAIGLEFVLPVLWQQLVVSTRLTALELWRSLSVRPAACLGSSSLRVSELKLTTLFDPELNWMAKGAAIASLSQNSPCYGKALKGKVLLLSHLDDQINFF